MPAYLATCAFGLESTVRYELELLGYSARIGDPGRVHFDADDTALCRSNLWLRTADRVLLVIGTFAAPDFDALFESTKALPWEAWIPADGSFPVNGRSRKSQLTSVPALQRAVKRAVVDRLRQAHRVDQLPESGPKYGIEVALLNDEALLTIDSTGPSLHKRGYRQRAGPAPLKETMAAALVQLSFWNAERPLIDPFCGSGTIPIEAARLGRNIAPGLQRSFAAEEWPQIEQGIWEQARVEARDLVRGPLEHRIIGTDADRGILRLARHHAAQAGVEEDIHFQDRSFEQLSSSRQFGCVITNPPYGQRIGETEDVEELHRTIPEVLRALPTWSHFILTAYPDFERLIGKQADRRRKLYNGRIECTYFQFHGPRPGALKHSTEGSPNSERRQDPTPPAEPSADTNTSAAPTAVKAGPLLQRQAFGGITAKAREQADLFRARLTKRARHFRRWPTKQGIHCFRLYEKDIPEIPLVVDRYEDHLHVTEYERPHDRDLAQHADWLDLMTATAAEALGVEECHVFLKKKKRQRGKSQHEKAARQGYEISVREGGLRFWVNLSDYVDTGLFLDHRQTRAMVREISRERRVLNLFAYTGTFSVYAADGGAAAVTTVDWSPAYSAWARRNFELNEFEGHQYQFVQQDARHFLKGLRRSDQYDLVVVDPPTFSNSKRTEDVWDVQRDHAEFLNGVLQHVVDGGRIYFSSNFRRFKLDAESISAGKIHEISRQTVPSDFRNQRIHRCWVIEK